jgi:hypothetical protein
MTKKTYRAHLVEKCNVKAHHARPGFLTSPGSKAYLKALKASPLYVGPSGDQPKPQALWFATNMDASDACSTWADNHLAAATWKGAFTFDPTVTGLVASQTPSEAKGQPVEFKGDGDSASGTVPFETACSMFAYSCAYQIVEKAEGERDLKTSIKANKEACVKAGETVMVGQNMKFKAINPDKDGICALKHAPSESS